MQQRLRGLLGCSVQCLGGSQVGGPSRGPWVCVRVFSRDGRRWDLPLRHQGWGCWKASDRGLGVSRLGRGQ